MRNGTVVLRVGVALLLACSCGSEAASDATQLDVDGSPAVGGASTGGQSSSDGGATGGAAGTGGVASGGTAGQASGGANTGGGEPPSCGDTYPYTDGFSCAQQAAWGKCGESWLQEYCDISCGRCGGGPECVQVGNDPCPMTSGLAHACRQRFALGVNYAWRSLGADFGGLPQWGQKSVSQAPAAFDQDLKQMRAHGATVVRWWMFPDFRGAGVIFDAYGDPIGVSDTVKADILKALELAHNNDLHLVLTIFSFDNFRPDRTEGGVLIRSMAPMVTNPTRRTRLLQNVVLPVAKAAASSPFVANLLGWDAVNEPEWAIQPASGAPAGRNFSPMNDLTAVPLADMKALINEMLTVLSVETPSVAKSVGWAAAKWSWAFGDLTRVDFHQPHIYAWVDKDWPYSSTPAALGYEGKPTVIGECYLQGNPFAPATTSFSTAAQSWFTNGYAGLWAWDYFSGNVKDPADPSFDLDLLQTFAAQDTCQKSY